MPEVSLEPRKPYIKNLRWWICGILFFATTINYVDRTSLSVLKDTLAKDMGWSEAQYGWINFFFSTSYAIFYTIAGNLVDLFGVRSSFAAAVLIWSAMAAAHAFARTWVGFAIARFLLGMAEAANFPASIKAVAQWFPQRERALATGIFNSGSNVGIIVSAVVVTIANKWHWQVAFIFIGSLGIIWAIFWLLLFRDPRQHPRLSPEELALIEGGKDKGTEKLKLPWTELLRYRQVWSLLVAKFFTDPVWWFFLYWLVPYFAKERGMSSQESANMLLFPYTASMIGSIVLGWLSGSLIKKGWAVGKSRYTAMFLCAIVMPSAYMVVASKSLYLSVFFISLCTAAHQGWSANLFTTASDLFPARMTGAVTGLGGTTGAIGGMLMTLLVGGILQASGNYGFIFALAGIMHPMSLILFRLIAGKDLKQVNMDVRPDMRRKHRGLIFAGSALSLISLVMLGLIIKNWDKLMAMSNTGKELAKWRKDGPAGGITAFVLTTLIGLAIIYAGLPKRQAQAV